MDIDFYEEESQIDNSLSEDFEDSHCSEESDDSLSEDSQDSHYSEESVDDRIHADILLKSIWQKLTLIAWSINNFKSLNIKIHEEKRRYHWSKIKFQHLLKIDILERMCEVFCRVFRDYYQQYLSEIENYYDETGDIVDNNEVKAAIPDETQNSILQFGYMIDPSDALVVAFKI